MLMFILKLFVLLLLLFIAYIIFTFICTLFIDVNKSYKTENRFYRFLLDSWTWIGIKLCRIKIKTTIHDELPENTRVVVVQMDMGGEVEHVRYVRTLVQLVIFYIAMEVVILV